ncbi:uncharacterized protein LOC111389232 [Olea europaea var. sylvestris]|uniref:uncharacterized protein LOC111389232 n=1 Tax=Olea europaea var. sylvestris TaxID=158386 RepID=UPI000C1D5808|nr:uncharacterized protein LOC111389232 [Olea europaea var. sylvestris]
MRRWLAALREVEKLSQISSDDKDKNNELHQLPEEQKSPRKQYMVLYYDSDMGGEPMTFTDVFLYSQALEGITICMVDKLKVLSESLLSSRSKAEKHISDNRVQKEEALKFRVKKASEVSDTEKELAAEASGLEKQRDELEAELKKIAAQARLHNMREERDQFYEANDQIVAHLKTKEEELSKSINSSRVEADVLSTWIIFLEDTWSLQCSHGQTKEKETNDELQTHEGYFVNLVIQLLSAYEIITTFSVVDNMREQFYAQQVTVSSKDDPKVKELFDKIAKIREEFESTERPNLEIENPPPRSDASTGEKLQESGVHSSELAAEAPEAGKDKQPEPPSFKSKQTLDHEAKLAKLESEFGISNRDYSAEEINDWEFDELEKELTSGD